MGLDTPRGGVFYSTDGDDFSRLGDYIGRNTHLTDLVVALGGGIALDVTNNEFYEGIKKFFYPSVETSFQSIHCRGGWSEAENIGGLSRKQ